MSIRCRYCDSRVPEWDSVQGCCRECWDDEIALQWEDAEQYRKEVGLL